MLRSTWQIRTTLKIEVVVPCVPSTLLNSEVDKVDLDYLTRVRGGAPVPLTCLSVTSHTEGPGRADALVNAKVRDGAPVSLKRLSVFSSLKIQESCL